MPIDPGTLSSVLSGNIPGPSDMLNATAGAVQNIANVRISEKQYERQRADALEFWNMQNEYNSPAAQMQRFKDAGLNPNLIYGRGESGQSGAISVPNVNPPNLREPHVGTSTRAEVMPLLLAQADLRIKNAQANNLEVQNDVIKQDALLRAFQAKRAGFDYDFENELRDTSLDYRRESLRGAMIQNDVAMNRDAREAAMNATSIQEAAERILSMQSNRALDPYRARQMGADTDRSRELIRQLIKDGVLKDLDIRLRRMNINPQDPIWARIVGGLLSDIVEKPDAVRDAVKGVEPYVPTVWNIFNNVWKK